ncbi:DUF397 domain-containing protein [Streptomyces sp. H10-C2]|uniref:DUF397 domain-containing protein n=1 Tax=unclassified Streptomyces TaxID=2593676 RepID=UPI0024BB7FDE|nr:MULTISPECIES: DUF397 domain-containing protein [unclassified Streptomyces]MDJ0347359.1 DUF397 domain-containing protein [Streptomyces sp. PH10-H1]MDJ0375569.1 DUF397 domain-containing protein [Streptomyces sp. H10-C2]
MHVDTAPTDDLRWFKSSYSGSSGSECVETASLISGMAVRDSKDPHGATLAFSAGAWAAFVAEVQSGRLGG